MSVRNKIISYSNSDCRSLLTYYYYYYPHVLTNNYFYPVFFCIFVFMVSLGGEFLPSSSKRAAVTN